MSKRVVEVPANISPEERAQFILVAETFGFNLKFKYSKYLEATTECLFCRKKSIQYFRLLEDVDGNWFKDAEIAITEVPGNVKIQEKDYTVFRCTNCRSFLEEKSKEELVDLCLNMYRRIVEL